jgi:hypothetical protein
MKSGRSFRIRRRAEKISTAVKQELGVEILFNQVAQRTAVQAEQLTDLGMEIALFANDKGDEAAARKYPDNHTNCGTTERRASSHPEKIN